MSKDGDPSVNGRIMVELTSEAGRLDVKRNFSGDAVVVLGLLERLLYEFKDIRKRIHEDLTKAKNAIEPKVPRL